MRMLRGNLHSALRMHAKAVQDFTKVIAMKPPQGILADAYHERRKPFQAREGQGIRGGFDEYLKLNLRRDPHWMRGIRIITQRNSRKATSSLSGIKP